MNGAAPTLALAALAAAGVLMATAFGPEVLSLSEIAAALAGGGDPAAHVIVLEIRLPRALAAFLVGACLGASGAALQGLLRNPLADPGVLGVSAFATLAAAVTVYFGLAVSPIATPAAAVLGAGVATAALAIVAARTESAVSLILIGVGLSSLAGALLALLMNFAPNPFTLSDMINWTLGSVANRGFPDIAHAAPFMAAGGALLALSARALSALTLGEEGAAAVGVRLARARVLTVAGAGLATGAAVSLAGAVGFVGLVAPHVVRPLVWHDPARTLVPAALAGGALLILADIIVRLAPTAAELKLGVVAALVGAPAFIWIAARRRTGDD